MILNTYSRWLLILIFSAILLPSLSWATQYTWVDYKYALTAKMRVCNFESAYIKVTIPFDFLKTQNEHIILVVDLRDLLQEADKYARYSSRVRASLYINKNLVTFKPKNYNQTIELKIKTKFLKPGENIIKASVSIPNIQILNTYCGYEISKIYFKEYPLSSNNTAQSSSQSEPTTPIIASPFIVKSIFKKSPNREENTDDIAVVIGNKIYAHRDIPSVKYADNDATAVKKYLIDTMGFKDGNIIFYKNASKATLEMIFGTFSNHRGMLYNYVKPEKSDVFIYYSGHGAPDPITNKAYLVPTDCNPVLMDLSAYSLDILYSNLPKIEAKSMTIVLDACFSGGTHAGQFLVPNASPALMKISNPLITLNDITILASSENNQVSSWYPEKLHSMFTYFFLKAVTGDADFNKNKQITFQEIYDFVANRAEGVPYYAKRLHGGRIQTPTMHSAHKDAVFVKY